MSRQLDFGYHAGTDLFLDPIMRRHPPHTNLDLTSWSPDSATGNTLTDGTGHAFVYDAWNRLAAARDGVGGTLLETYAYDGTGRRLSQTLTAAGAQAAGGVAAGATAGVTDLYYSSAWQVLEEQQAGVATAQYVWSPVYVNALVERDAHDPATSGDSLNQRLYALQDANYNVTALFDATTGQVVQRLAYDAYGKQTVLAADWTVSSAAPLVLRGFQGGLMDQVTGNLNFQQRDYNPTTMTWNTQDPLGFVDGMNPYRPMAANPINHVDSTGLATDAEPGPGKIRITSIKTELKNAVSDARPSTVDAMSDAIDGVGTVGYIQDAQSLAGTISTFVGEGLAKGLQDLTTSAADVAGGHAMSDGAAEALRDRILKLGKEADARNGVRIWVLVRWQKAELRRNPWTLWTCKHWVWVDQNNDKDWTKSSQHSTRSGIDDLAPPSGDGFNVNDLVGIAQAIPLAIKEVIAEKVK